MLKMSPTGLYLLCQPPSKTRDIRVNLTCGKLSQIFSSAKSATVLSSESDEFSKTA